MNEGKPIIGIVAYYRNSPKERLETFIREEVEQAIFDNEGITIENLMKIKFILKINGMIN